CAAPRDDLHRSRRTEKRGRRIEDQRLPTGVADRVARHQRDFPETLNRTPMSNILKQNWLLSRRHFLHVLGDTVALPLLVAMIPLRARAAVAASKPRRSVFFYIPNGVNGMTWQVTKPGRDYELSPSLKPLAKHREDFTVFSGLHHPNGLGQAHV